MLGALQTFESFARDGDAQESTKDPDRAAENGKPSPMTSQAKAFIALLSLTGIAALTAGLLHPSWPDWAQFACYLLAVVLASGFKVALPGHQRHHVRQPDCDPDFCRGAVSRRNPGAGLRCRGGANLVAQQADSAASCVLQPGADRHYHPVVLPRFSSTPRRCLANRCPCG